MCLWPGDFSPQEVAISPAGDLVASVGQGLGGGEVHLWRAADGAFAGILAAHKLDTHAVAFSSDGQFIAAAGQDRIQVDTSRQFEESVRLWRVADAAPLATLIGAQGPIESVAFAPDGRTIAASSEDATVRIWSTVDGSPLSVLRGHVGAVYSVVFAPKGERLVSGSLDDTIRWWGLR